MSFFLEAKLTLLSCCSFLKTETAWGLDKSLIDSVVLLWVVEDGGGLGFGIKSHC